MPDTPTPPAPPPPAPPTAEILALLPMWARAGVVLIPVLGAGLGSLGGALTGGQAVATEQAVLAAEVQRVKEDVQAINNKIDRLTELVLRGDR